MSNSVIWLLNQTFYTECVVTTKSTGQSGESVR